ncbi:MAG: MBOAT family O-acyltransferase, partial [Nannocystaceae bacterium]
HARPRLRREDVDEALFRIFKGLFKKVVLGDWLAVAFTDVVFDTPGAYTSWENMLALYGFTLQIYADFSGYSDIAIGVARLLGFKIPENFDRPYQAKNLGEFWRRWHMTLSTWLRDYLFFPLGGSRGSAARTYFNVWLTMFLVGMWHGASWNFVIYSNLHGLAMLFNRWNRLRTRERSMLETTLQLTALAAFVGLTMHQFGVHVLVLDPELASRGAALGALFTWICAALPVTGGRMNHVLHVALTFHFTVVSRVFFRADDLGSAREMCAQVLRWDGRGVRPGLFKVEWMEQAVLAVTRPATWLQDAGVWVSEHGMLLLLLFGTCWHFTPRGWIDVHLRRRMDRLPAPMVGVAYAALALLLMKLLTGPRANIYFAF